MREAGREYNGFTLKNREVEYNSWEADRIFGCVCDSHWGGHGCTQPLCPYGQDPLIAATAEVQSISCACTNSPCGDGFFSVTYAGRTRPIYFNAVASTSDEDPYSMPETGAFVGESVESVLRSLRDIPYVASVSFSNGASARACDPGNIISVTFLTGAGDIPLIEANAGLYKDIDGTYVAGGSHLHTQEVAAGTAIPQECSGRGKCNREIGVCECYDGYFSSDGDGNPGSIGDCGSLSTIQGGVIVTSVISQCPGTPQCNGRGWCDTTGGEYKCQCYRGFAGGACDIRVCPSGPAWFDEPLDSVQAHQPATCSNMGVCNDDINSGVCQCASGFTGAACEKLACPSHDSHSVCSGHGRCLSLRRMAQVVLDTGIHPSVRAEYHMECSLASGGILLRADYAITAVVPWDAPLTELKRALELLPNVGTVEVVSDPPFEPQICSAPGTTVHIRFDNIRGGVKVLDVTEDAASKAGWDTGTVTVTQTESREAPLYGEPPIPSTWDADMLQGCLCDGLPNYNATGALGSSGLWSGHQCISRSCPVAIDPLARYAKGDDADEIRAGTDEDTPPVPAVMRLSCKADGGFFRLSNRNRMTGDIAPNLTPAELVQMLQTLPSVGLVSAVVMVAQGSTTPAANQVTAICQPLDVVDTLITFETELGDIPLMQLDSLYLENSSDSLYATIQMEQQGTGVPKECAGRGICDKNYGLCKCFPGWLSSDGRGQRGSRGDCGYFDILAVPKK